MFFNLWARLSYFLKDFSLYLIIIFIAIILVCVSSYKVFRSTISQASKKIYLSGIFTFLFFIFTFTAFEGYFRYVYDESDGLGFLKVNQRWHARYVVHNNYFFRDRDFDINKRQDVIRIGVLGDSIAFGGGIKDVNKRFSNILEKKLNAAGFRVEVYNLGTPGYDTEGEIEQYNKVKQLNFDIIVWEYFLNDIQLQDKSTGTPIIIKNSKTGRLVTFLSDKSFFFDYLFWKTSQRYNKTLGELRTADLDRFKDAQQLKIHKEEINAFIKGLQQENKKFVVIIFPLLYFLGPNYPAVDVHGIMSAHFKDNNVEVVDMLDYLKDKKGRDLWASEFDSHPNEYVHQLAAEKLFDKVVSLLK